MLELEIIIGALKLIIMASVLFVWFVRYDNIIKEFVEYKYPNWLRDLVGILKISCVFMLQSSDVNIVKIGCLGLIFLMAAAVSTHLRVRNSLGKLLPSLTLMSLSIFIYLKV